MLFRVPVLKVLGVLLLCALLLFTAFFAKKLYLLFNPPLHSARFWIGDTEYDLPSRIERGEDLNKPGLYGVTPLQVAARWGEPSSIELLIENGANVFELDKFGKSLLFHAVDGGPIENIKIFLNKGVDVNKVDKFGTSPLHKAVSLGTSYNTGGASVTLLISAGAKLDSQLNDSGDTPLHWAATSYYPSQTLKPLLEAGADPDMLNYQGESALHVAVRTGEEQASRLLLSFGADTSLQDKYNKTPLDYALSQKKEGVVWESVLEQLH